MWIIGREIVIKRIGTAWRMAQQTDFVIAAIDRFESDNPHRVGYAAPIAWGIGEGKSLLCSWVAFSTSDGNILVEFSQSVTLLLPAGWEIYKNSPTPTKIVAGNWVPEQWQSATKEKRDRTFSQVANRLNLLVENYF